MTITTKYSIGDRVDLGLFEPQRSGEIVKITDLNIRISVFTDHAPSMFEVEYWYTNDHTNYDYFIQFEDGKTKIEDII